MAWLKKDKTRHNLPQKKIEHTQKELKRVLKKSEKLLKVSESKEVEVTQKINPHKLPIKKNAIHRFFSRGSDKFPFIETIKYTSRVAWLKGRPAWIADYASHFCTSRHFIARGLNKKEDYDSQRVSFGDQFNVFKIDFPVEFHLVANLSDCEMDFYCVYGCEKKKEFIKTYKISIGRIDEQATSGHLTPLGKFTLGEKIAVYKPGVTNFFQNQKIEMMRVFGTRWLPFDKEIGDCTDGAKGYGLHGLPCNTMENGEVVEDLSLEGTRSSDGCLRLRKKDIEEIFSIVITKPTIIEIVNQDVQKKEQEPLENIIVQNSDRHS